MSCLLGLVSTSARAQESGPAPEAAPEGSPTAEVPPTPAPSAEPVDPKFADAKQRFLQGVALADAGNCEGAISELRASYELVPRTNTLFNIATCYEKLFQYTLAIETYKTFLELASADDPDRVRVEATIAALAGLLGTLSISSNIEAEVWLGNRRIGEAPGKVLIPGGRHVVELRAEGYLATRQEVQIAGREEKALEFVLIVAQKKVTITKIESRGLKPVYFWSGVAATGLVVAGGSYFGLRARLEDSSAREIDSRLPRENERDDIELLANTADALFIGATALAVGTTVLYFMTDWDKEKRRKSRSSLSLTPSFGPSSLGVQLGGRL